MFLIRKERLIDGISGDDYVPSLAASFICGCAWRVTNASEVMKEPNVGNDMGIDYFT